MLNPLSNASKVPHGHKEDKPQNAPGTSNQRFKCYCQNASEVPHGQKEDKPQIAPVTSNQRFDLKSVYMISKPDLSVTSTCMRKAWSTTLLSIQYGRGGTCTLTDGICSVICCCRMVWGSDHAASVPKPTHGRHCPILTTDIVVTTRNSSKDVF